MFQGLDKIYSFIKRCELSMSKSITNVLCLIKKKSSKKQEKQKSNMLFHLQALYAFLSRFCNTHVYIYTISVCVYVYMHPHYLNRDTCILASRFVKKKSILLGKLQTQITVGVFFLLIFWHWLKFPSSFLFGYFYGDIYRTKL